MRVVLLTAALSLSACSFFEQVGEAITGAVESRVAIGVVSSVEIRGLDRAGLPEDMDFGELSEGMAGTVFVAEAKEIAAIQNAPVSGMDIQVTGCGASAGLSEQGSGLYTMLPPTAIDDCSGGSFTIALDPEASASFIDVALPPRPSVLPPFEGTQDQGITLDWSGQGYDSALIVVVDTLSGQVTYSNEPQEILDYYNFLKGNDKVSVLDIPGEAFPKASVYAVALTGFERVRAANLEELNTVLTTVSGGRTVVSLVSTLPVGE